MLGKLMHLNIGRTGGRAVRMPTLIIIGLRFIDPQQGQDFYVLKVKLKKTLPVHCIVTGLAKWPMVLCRSGCFISLYVICVAGKGNISSDEEHT